MMCYLCNLRKANTLEHIAPKFLGGKKTFRLLCHKCNNEFGTKIESQFYLNEQAKKLTILKIMLNFYLWQGGSYEEVSPLCRKLYFSLKEDKIYDFNLQSLPSTNNTKLIKLWSENGKINAELQLNKESFVCELGIDENLNENKTKIHYF